MSITRSGFFIYRHSSGQIVGWRFVTTLRHYIVNKFSRPPTLLYISRYLDKTKTGIIRYWLCEVACTDWLVNISPLPSLPSWPGLEFLSFSSKVSIAMLMVWKVLSVDIYTYIVKSIIPNFVFRNRGPLRSQNWKLMKVFTLFLHFSSSRGYGLAGLVWSG